MARWRASAVVTKARARGAASRGIGWSGEGRDSETVGLAGGEPKGVGGRADVTGSVEEARTARGASLDGDEQPTSTSAAVTPAPARLIIPAILPVLGEERPEADGNTPTHGRLW
jgi:hypothetical protein